MIHLGACLHRTWRSAHALRRPRLFPPRPHPGSTHPLAVATLPGLRQAGPSRRRPRRRQVAPHRRPCRPWIASWGRSGGSGASASSASACGRTAGRSGNGPIRSCRTAPNDADEGKADRPPSRAVSALRPWPAANPQRGRNEPGKIGGENPKSAAVPPWHVFGQSERFVVSRSRPSCASSPFPPAGDERF
jgi:hypothetical protein